MTGLSRAREAVRERFDRAVTMLHLLWNAAAEARGRFDEAWSSSDVQLPIVDGIRFDPRK